jgi:DNA-binding NarL/FixJ family response regulator
MSAAIPAMPLPMTAAQPAGMLDELTDREVDVLRLLDQRLSNKEIAMQLVISPLTVKTHASNIYSKLGVGNRREAIRIARKRGLLSPA